MDAIMWPSRSMTSKRRWRFTRTFSISNRCVAAKAMRFSNWANTSSLQFSRWIRCNRRTCGISGSWRDEAQLAEVRKKLQEKYKLKLEPPFRCDFRDPWGNRIQVVDLHDESLVWLLPYGEVQKAGIKFDTK